MQVTWAFVAARRTPRCSSPPTPGVGRQQLRRADRADAQPLDRRLGQPGPEARALIAGPHDDAVHPADGRRSREDGGAGGAGDLPVHLGHEERAVGPGAVELEEHTAIAPADGVVGGQRAVEIGGAQRTDGDAGSGRRRDLAGLQVVSVAV